MMIEAVGYINGFGYWCMWFALGVALVMMGCGIADLIWRYK